MIKDKNNYSILVIEDNPGDYIIVEDFLSEQILAAQIIHALSFKQATQILSTPIKPFDVILLDLSLPDKSGQLLVREILQISSEIPVIILTGFTDIDFSIRSISQGISDYLIKDDLNPELLYKSILYAIERKKKTAELKESEKRYSDLFHFSPQPMCLYEKGTFRFTKINKAAIEQYGYSEEEFFNMTLLDLVPAEERIKAIEAVTSQNRVLNETYQSVSRVYKKSGDIMEVETYSTPIIINSNEFTLVIAIDVTEKKLYEHKITKAIIKTQDDERYEIGGELHDNVCQLLAASQISLSMLKVYVPPEKIKWFDSCKEHITQASDEIRNLAHRLAPAFFDESTLEEAFRRLFNSFNLSADYEIVLNFDKNVSLQHISLELQLNLYRILQEQLRNILKYAKATLIEVDIIFFNNKLKMKVSDNGIGFDVNVIKGGIGLANMKRRAELFSGKFELISSVGEGCSILVDIPL